MPEPFATPSADNAPQIVPQPAGTTLHLPPGFHATVFADRLDNPRWMTVAPNGDVLCVESDPGRVILLRDTSGKGRANFRKVFAQGLNLPFGIAIWKNYLYVANTNSIIRFSYRPGQTAATGPPQTIVSGIPGRGYHQHWTRDLIFNPSGTKMYLSVGSSVNIGEEPAPRACIVEYNPDGSGRRIFANGIRNAVGKAFDPTTGDMWCTVNERDGLGDDLVPDFVASVHAVSFFGWPWYYIGAHHDPRMPARPELLTKGTRVPEVLIASHSAALGICFYTGSQFPHEYRGDAFVALHGSWNRRQRTGYKVIRIPFKNGKPEGGYEDFLTGWMISPNSRRVWGRPVGIAQAKDGSLLVVDDGANKIWRIWYGK